MEQKMEIKKAWILLEAGVCRGTSVCLFFVWVPEGGSQLGQRGNPPGKLWWKDTAEWRWALQKPLSSLHKVHTVLIQARQHIIPSVVVIWISLFQEAFLCMDKGTEIRLRKSPVLFCSETLQAKQPGGLALTYILLLIQGLDFVLWKEFESFAWFFVVFGFWLGFFFFGVCGFGCGFFWLSFLLLLFSPPHVYLPIGYFALSVCVQNITLWYIFK